MPLTKNFYEGTPGQDMTFDDASGAYVGVTMDGQRVKVSKEDYEAEAQTYFNTNMAMWWLFNRPQKCKVS